MFYDERVHHVTGLDPVAADQLARDLTEHGWTLCTGFRIGDLVCLNDSRTPDFTFIHQEYAVYRIDDLDAYAQGRLVGRQVESLTVTAFRDAAALRDTILSLLSGEEADVVMGPRETRVIDIDPAAHRCGYCN